MSLDLRRPAHPGSRPQAGGGQMSELFLERSTGLMIVMDDGKVEKVLGGVDQGAGLRLIYDLKTAYAYGNQFSQEALLPLARNLALLWPRASRWLRGRFARCNRAW